MLRTLISVSTHPAKNEISKYVRSFENAKVDMFHCDVMDGKFVKDTAFNIDLLKQLKQLTTLPLDVHLMVENAHEQAIKYCQNGANIVTVHKECFKNNKSLIKCLQTIQKHKVLAGVSIKPSTEIKEIENILKYCNIVLVMSVEPGASGQSFMPECLEKINQLNILKQENNYKYLIEVDGGINAYNAQSVVNAGANILVSGSFLYKSKDLTNAVKLLKI